MPPPWRLWRGGFAEGLHNIHKCSMLSSACGRNRAQVYIYSASYISCRRTHGRC